MLNAMVQDRKIDEYPFNVIDFDRLALDAPVIFFTGANGCGKSTLLRAMASLSQAIDLGKGTKEEYDYHQGFTLSWSHKLKRGYYFQSEDFYTYLQWAKEEIGVNQQMLDEAEERHTNKTRLEYLLETGLHKANRQSMSDLVYDYMNVSHGEGYINFFAERLRSQTLYLLDEPETPLSFQNQLSLLTLIDDYVKEGSQFIMCTHSPILLAYPNALIYYFNEEGISEISYADHPLVKDYTLFLDNPERFMHYLLKG